LDRDGTGSSPYLCDAFRGRRHALQYGDEGARTADREHELERGDERRRQVSNHKATHVVAGPIVQNDPSGGISTELRRQFHDAGLPFPPLPDAWIAGLHRLAPWVYSTHSLDPGPNDVLHYVAEAEEGVAPLSLAIAHTGHGADGYYLHLFAVRGPVALFFQLAWGGPRRSGPQAAMHIARIFAELDVLLGAVAERTDLAELGPSRRLIVLVSDLHGSAWRWADDGGRPLAARLHPRRELETMREAVAAIRARTTT
jgi:hypothetical protein